MSKRKMSYPVMHLAARVPTSWIRALDRVASEHMREHGEPFSRGDAIRNALYVTYEAQIKEEEKKQC